MHSDRAKQQHRCGRHFYCRGLANVLPINVSFFVTNVVPLTTTRYLHTHTHIVWINKKFTANSFPLHEPPPMEPLSPTIDGRRSFDRLYTSLPSSSIQLAIKCIVVSFGVARETPIYLLPLGWLLRSFEYFRQVEFRAAFMGFFRNFNDVQLREFVRFLFLQWIFVELVANHLRITASPLIATYCQYSPTIFFQLLSKTLTFESRLKERKPQIYIFRRETKL